MFRLAETYDPRILSQWRAVGISGDARTAHDLYAKAADAGYQPASDRLANSE
jgi:hypothetical protein